MHQQKLIETTVLPRPMMIATASPVIGLVLFSNFNHCCSWSILMLSQKQCHLLTSRVVNPKVTVLRSAFWLHCRRKTNLFQDHKLLQNSSLWITAASHTLLWHSTLESRPRWIGTHYTLRLLLSHKVLFKAILVKNVCVNIIHSSKTNYQEASFCNWVNIMWRNYIRPVVHLQIILW